MPWRQFGGKRTRDLQDARHRDAGMLSAGAAIETLYLIGRNRRSLRQPSIGGRDFGNFPRDSRVDVADKNDWVAARRFSVVEMPVFGLPGHNNLSLTPDCARAASDSRRKRLMIEGMLSAKP